MTPPVVGSSSRLIGRAHNTVDAYGRAVDDHLRFCRAVGANPLTSKPDVIAAWIGDLRQRPNSHVVNVLHLNSRVGLSNATIQQRIIAVRSFYEYLVEDGLRQRNPVRRGESCRGGGQPKRGLVRLVERAPWIPNELAWASILDACRIEPVRNRLMVAMAYDGALRREELVQVEIDDLEPAYSLIHLRAETTKSKRPRDVAFGAATGQLLVGYLRERRGSFGRVNGRLFLSTSRRNRGAPIGPWSWSKVVDAIAERAGLPRFSTHTFRHMRLTDLARADWTVDQIAQYAGHRNLSTTMLYIRLSGRELAAKFQRSMAAIHLERVAFACHPRASMTTAIASAAPLETRLFNLNAYDCHRTPKGGHRWTRQKRPLSGSADLAEQRSTSVIKEFGQKHRLVAVDARAADAQGMHEQVAVGAAADANETFATTRALVDDVSATVSKGALGIRSG